MLWSITQLLPFQIIIMSILTRRCVFDSNHSIFDLPRLVKHPYILHAKLLSFTSLLQISLPTYINILRLFDRKGNRIPFPIIHARLINGSLANDLAGMSCVARSFVEANI